MPNVLFKQHILEIQDNETVLECLERNNISPLHSCRSGHCQACTMTCQKGQLPANSQVGLPSTKVKLGAFLPCICRPSEDIAIKVNEHPILAAKVIERKKVTTDIARIRIARPAQMEIIPGQFIHICVDEHTRRSYSVANQAMQDNFIELHVRHVPGGKVSPWLTEQIEPGDLVNLAGPYGACFYTEDARDQPLILAGTSTGLAPLLGILKDALAQGHRGSIDLYHGAVSPDGLYLRDTLRGIAQAHEQVNIHWSTLNGANPNEQIHATPIGELIKQQHPCTKDLRAYLCGAPAFVKAIKRDLFLSGTPFQQIFSDPFSG